MSEDGYPCECDLKFIADYDILKSGIEGLIEHLQRIWHWEDYIKWDGENLELHTGGWSGNESIIQVLEKTFFWFFYWQKSERGGHYYLTVPKRRNKDAEDQD